MLVEPARKLSAQQGLIYASKRYSLLLIFQGMEGTLLDSGQFCLAAPTTGMSARGRAQAARGITVSGL